MLGFLAAYGSGVQSFTVAHRGRRIQRRRVVEVERILQAISVLLAAGQVLPSQEALLD